MARFRFDRAGADAHFVGGFDPGENRGDATVFMQWLRKVLHL